MGVRVWWEGAEIVGVRRAGPLRRRTDLVELRDGATPWLIQKSPELTHYDPVLFERELGSDIAFESWAALVAPFPIGPQPEPPAYRKDVTLQLFDSSGQPLASYCLTRAWPIDYELLIDEGGSALERLTLVYEGFARLPSTEPYPRAPA